MPKINTKCQECAKTEYKRSDKKPVCWVKENKRCARKRYHYRHLKQERLRLIKSHRYNKYRNDKCCICNIDKNLESHHIIPIVKGGIDARFNIVTLCRKCHDIITAYYVIIGWNRKSYVRINEFKQDELDLHDI